MFLASEKVSIVSNKPEPIQTLGLIQTLLKEAQLPYEDLTVATHSQFWGLGAPQYYAVIGLERYEELGLLRSLAVAQPYRRQRLGQRLVQWVEQEAQQAGLRQLYLLTISATAFFEALGYERLERNDLPPALYSSSQVQGVCPASAPILVKTLI